MIRRILVGLSLLLSATAWAGTPTPSTHKGSFFLHWGYNRAWYGRSDIHFAGTGYDFTLHDVVARDRPEPFGKYYFKPANIWIPQYNYRLGWHFRERWSVSLGLDHMKYVVAQGQVVRMQGYADSELSHLDTGVEGSRDVTLLRTFLSYEHTDGLNLLSVDLDHYSTLWSSASGAQYLRFHEGVHAGPVIPRTDVRLFGTGINNRFNMAGFGLGVQAGFHFTFLKHFYIRNTLKAGWIDLPKVLTTGNDADRADQHFRFLQHAIVFGGQFRLYH